MISKDYVTQKRAETENALDLTFDLENFEDTRATRHAVYVVMTNQIDVRVTNWYCFMVVSCTDGATDDCNEESLCETYCKVQRRNPFQQDEIFYIDSDTPGCETTTFTNEFELISNNEVTCPIIHYYTTDDLATTSSDSDMQPISLTNFNKIDASFSLASPTFDTSGYRYVTIHACMAGVNIDAITGDDV